MTTVETRTPLVEMSHMNVAFGGVHAVEDCSIDLIPGEVVAIVGGNGAGKTTLIRCLSGAHPADSGEIKIDGEPASIHNPRDAKAYGVETIYQTLALSENQDAPSNMFLGRELRSRWGTLDDMAMEALLEKLAKGEDVKRGSQKGRTSSEPYGELTSLMDESLFSGEPKSGDA